MEIIVEHAGADYGALLIRENKIPSRGHHIVDVYSELGVKAVWEGPPEKRKDEERKNAKRKKEGHVTIHSNMIPLNGSIIPGTS